MTTKIAKFHSIMEYASYNSDPFLRWYLNFIYHSHLDRFVLFNYWIDRILVKLHFILFHSWIEKKLRQYLGVYKKYHGTITIIRGIGTTTVFTPEYLWLKRQTGSFMNQLMLQSLANPSDTTDIDG